MKPPAFQFYADDFLAGTITMTLEERGIYITLLCIQWSRGSVCDADFDRVGNAVAQPSLSQVKAKFVRSEHDGLLRNPRLEHERQKQAEYRQKQSANAAKRWVGNATALPPHIPNACSPSPSPSPSPVSSLQSPPPKVTRVPKLHVGGAGDVRSAKASPPSDEEWLESLAKNPAYAGIDINVEVGKCAAWCSVHGKKASRRRFINWLNRAERPINGNTRNHTSRPHGPAQSELQPNLAARLAKLDAGGDEWPAKPGASPNPVG